MAKSKKSIQISEEAWKAYTDKLYNVSATAGKKMEEYILKHGLNDRNALIDYAYGLVTKYSEGTSALAAQMYDEIAAAENALTLSAEVIATPSYDEVAKTVHGTLKRSKNEKSLGGAIQYLVKRNGADTVLHNALRDHAQFAWIPGAGETCSFCRILASNGWRYMSKKALKNGHAEHIHANCRCTYAIRFSEQSNIQGYDPDKYYQEYVEAGRDVNEMRRLQYQNNKELADKIKAQKREAYAKRKAIENSQDVDIINQKKVFNTKILADGSVANPMDRDDYLKMKESLEKQGIEVFAATDGDDLRYMQFIGAEGTYSNGRITHIGEVPSRGTMLEEIIHMHQSREYGELETSDIKELCAREVEANRKLFKYRNEYKLDELDIADIEKNLNYWEKSFEKATGVPYDESNYRK